MFQSEVKCEMICYKENNINRKRRRIFLKIISVSFIDNYAYFIEIYINFPFFNSLENRFSVA